MRFYENVFPAQDEYVVVQVERITESGAYVRLLEYGLEGLIQFNEISRRKVKTVTNIIRVGKTEICIVLSVDKEKGYIDLSKRRVNPDFVSEKDTQYHQAKTVHSIIQHVADITDFDFEDLVKIIAWPLYKKFGFAYGAFQNGSREPEKVFGIIRFPDEKVRKALMNTIELRLKPKPTKLRADFEVSCFSKAGIDGVKDILYQGLAFSTKEVPIEIQLISPPLYTMIANALDVKSGLGVLNNALAAMERRSKIVHGNCVIKIQPRAVTAREDHSFHLLMEQLRDEREEHDDTDSEEEEEEEFIGL